MSKRVLPLIPAGLVVDQVWPVSDTVIIQATPHQASPCCPTCAHPSHRLHSRYQRTLADLPWQGRPVALHVHARRFRCLNPSCPRQTFAERLPGVASAARRTERLGTVHNCLGLALGGEAGQRLAERLGMPVSADTLLRLTRETGNDNVPSGVLPRVIAVDDWAWRRGHRYGTILVDLERNAAVDLLPDRQAETLAAWLRQHPSVEVVARDRAGAYADGVRQGAPDAVQVADRWHLLRNLGEAVRAVVDRHHAAIRRAAEQMSRQLANAAAASQVEPDRHRSSTAARHSQASYARRHARYEDAARLRAAGVSISRIAAQLGAERTTIRHWLRIGGAPRWRKPPRASVLAPFHDHLERRWAEGCRNAALLWRELVQLGFPGRPGLVRAWAGQRRKGEPRAIAGQAGMQSLSARHVARLLMSDADALPNSQQAFVSGVLGQVPALAAAIAVAKRLNLLLRRKSQQDLAGVLADADGTLLEPFADGIRRDLAAVQAALELPWTTSPAEGQINRLKMLKRTMYGRAGFPLLRTRVLHAA